MQRLDVIGFSPRCLNEGLVEYFEFLDVSMQVGKAGHLCTFLCLLIKVN
ncbi:hypothetical protein N478_11315 [Pseudoalteromonas luteoviolacea S4060-1]|uniref:Uncharacterized protein n=1 Tax=Pseudoalteromonas luteoviolacea S4060-1 TaxID=1365257 RepID=A0A162CK11_9GAMM|nr:hypothetical protein N478_11315 [Pseudoalteromonas luteoviolacea S4060-1]